jgi:hypothetical protein
VGSPELILNVLAWYEWYPAPSIDFTGIRFHHGDEVRLTVRAKTTTSGWAEIENLTTGKRVSKFITSTFALCEKNAEWIVEDYEQGGGLVPFANFGKVKFSHAEATRHSGAVVGPLGAQIFELQQGSNLLTHVSKTPTSVTVTYI